jgi:hypothetical protein
MEERRWSFQVIVQRRLFWSNGCTIRHALTGQGTLGRTVMTMAESATLRRLLLGLVLAIVAAATAGCTKTEEHLRTHFTKHSELVDPASAMFRNITYRELSFSTEWCGEINAKNRFGGYVGWTQFMVKAYKDGDVSVIVLQLSDASLEPNVEKRDALAELNRGLAEVHAMLCQGGQPAPTWIPFWTP